LGEGGLSSFVSARCPSYTLSEHGYIQMSRACQTSSKGIVPVPAINRRLKMTLTRSMVVLALAAFSASVYAEPTYPNKHQKEVIPEAQRSDSQQKFEPEQDKGSQSTQYPSKHSNETVRDRDTKKKASERASEREQNASGQTVPEPRN
jgi:hypothetical protein